MKALKRLYFRLMVVCTALILAGCSSRITTENYDQIKMGMPFEGVVAILGKADVCDGAMGIKNCSWGDEDRNITVSFAGERVILFSAKGL